MTFFLEVSIGEIYIRTDCVCQIDLISLKYMKNNFPSTVYMINIKT